MDQNINYISIKHLFKTYKYFQHHFIIKNVFTQSMCEWVYSYNTIELNPFLLFTIPHILKLINTNYNINYHVNYQVQDIKIISNKSGMLYSSFLQKYDFKLIIPLSNCNITFNNELNIEVNCGEILVITDDRTFLIQNDVNIISIDIIGSFDVINMTKYSISDNWWLKHVPTMQSECLRYIQTDANFNNLQESTMIESGCKIDETVTSESGNTQAIKPNMNTTQKLRNISPDISMVNEYIYIATTNLDVDVIKCSCTKLNNFIINNFGNENPDFKLTQSIPTRIYSKYNLLMYPFPGFHSVYKKIQEIFYICYRNRNNCNDVPPHFIQCWLNVVYKNDLLDWHSHADPELDAWHGYMYVDVQDSVPTTLYDLPGYQDIVTIYGKNSNIVISPSHGDQHKTVLWTKENPRISIAFDIIPISALLHNDTINHWVPI